MLTSKFTVNPSSADSLSFTLDSFPDGLEVQASLIFKAELKNYPSSVPLISPVTITFRECFPENGFLGYVGEVPDQIYVDKDMQRIEIPLTFSQEPCEYA